MFYNDRKTARQRKRTVVICSMLAVAFIVWVIFIIRINLAFPDKEILTCNQGEWMDYSPDIEHVISADVSISPVSCVMYTQESLQREYSDYNLNFLSNSSNSKNKYLVFEISIKNNGNEVINAKKLTTFFMYATPFNGDCNCFDRITDEGEDVAPGETKKVKLVTLVHELDAVLVNCHERYVKSEVYIILTQYPIERRLVFNIREQE